MIYCEYRFTSETDYCGSNQSVDNFLSTLALYKEGEVIIREASIDGIKIDVNHLLEVLIL